MDKTEVETICRQRPIQSSNLSLASADRRLTSKIDQYSLQYGTLVDTVASLTRANETPMTRGGEKSLAKKAFLFIFFSQLFL